MEIQFFAPRVSMPTFSTPAAFTALVESDPAWTILEVAAYRELLLRQRINDASRAVMLAFATGADLEHLGQSVEDW